MTGRTHWYRYEVRSARHLGELAAAPLPLPIAITEPRRSQHRDLFLDTSEGTLRKRNIVCRLRLRSDDTRSLSLNIGAKDGNDAARYDADVRSADFAGAIAEATTVGRRLSAIIDPAQLKTVLELEVERLTRNADRDWLGRPIVELHYDCIVARQNGSKSTFFKLCLHRLRGDDSYVERLARSMEAACRHRTLPPGGNCSMPRRPMEMRS